MTLVLCYVVYNVHEGDIGKIYWLLCKAEQLYSLLPKFGGYAHGTIEKLGKISLDNLYRRNCEYALRPNFLAKPNKETYGIKCLR